ncbi:apolipoprotein N-acyltransferase [Lysobacter sp. yr284]|uniref:apolipoprotein N-acyltransferase n=1 Tax=Lysobacter sp. yr284 TaxID=1761791 RepID=UPI00089A0445|nr:apolipoprotein N-acyltransferase [Lysobacter sp. yr284]SDY27620.1 apolipoprotein N-acyltransferase [Lysobacter sp. yr284]
MSRWRGLAGILATAVLLGLYARGGLAWGLGFVALVPWLLALGRGASLRGALASGALMSVAFVAAVFYWFGAAIGAYLGVGAGAATAALLALAPLMQPQWLAFALARQWAGRRYGPALRALAATSAWLACEWLVPKLLGDTLGHGLYPSAALRQVADLGGAAGLTALLLLVNEAFATALERRRQGLRALARPLTAAALIVACMGGYGMVRRASLLAPPVEAPSLRVAMVQASIVDYERLRARIGAQAVVRKVLDAHYALSASAINDHGADVLLWSETVYPTSFGHPRSQAGAEFDRELQGFVDHAGVPLVFGTYDRDALGEYNAAAFLEPGKGLLGMYRKTYPFLLTEYVPAWLDGPRLRSALPWTGGWRAGDGARVLPLRSADGREVQVVPLICLDDVHPGLAIDGARLGAQAIVGMSNDSWFTDYPVGARLHLTVAAFRSIETGLPQVRVTSNGLSAIIDETGEVLAHTATGDQAVLTATIGARDPAPTLMVRWGDWVGRAGAAFLLALAALAAWQSARRRADAAPARVETAVEVVVLTPPWRALAGAMRLCAGLGLALLAYDMLTRIGLQIQSLAQLRWFAAAVLAPIAAAWAIGRAFAAQARVEAGVWVLEQRRQRIELPLAALAALRPWRLPLPGRGVDVRLAEGPRWTRSLALARPQSLHRLLAAGGAPVRWEGRFAAAWADWAQARADAYRRRLDHPLAKFALFPLLLALVAFRLHQVIAFGGTFGEYYSYGLGAYLSGLLIWWASWSIGLMLLAAVLRIGIEAAVAPSLIVRATQAAAVRDALEWLGRAVFYLGVPAWLAWRLLSAG